MSRTTWFRLPVVILALSCQAAGSGDGSPAGGSAEPPGPPGAPGTATADADADVDTDTDADTDADTDTDYDLIDDELGPLQEGIGGYFGVFATHGDDEDGYHAHAQFFDVVEEGWSAGFGEVIDDLEGIDDCGLWSSTGDGLADESVIDWFTVGTATLTSGEQGAPFSYWNGGEVENYDLDLASLGYAPRYGEPYSLSATGGELPPIELTDALTLPGDLVLTSPSLTSGGTVSAADLASVAWTGTSDLLVELTITFRDSLSYTLRCEAADDGAFEVPGALLEHVSAGTLLRLEVTRFAVGFPEAADGRVFYAIGSTGVYYTDLAFE